MRRIYALIIAGILIGLGAGFAADNRFIVEIDGQEPDTTDISAATASGLLDGYFVKRSGGDYTHGEADVDMRLYGDRLDVIQRGFNNAAYFSSNATTSTMQIYNTSTGNSSVSGLYVRTGDGGAIQGVDQSNSGFGVGGSGFQGIAGIQTNGSGSAVYGLGSLKILGSYNQIQALIKGYATQTANIVEVQSSAGVPYFTIDNAARTTVADLTIVSAGGPSAGAYLRSLDNNGTTVWDAAPGSAAGLDEHFVRRGGDGYIHGDASLDMRLWSDAFDVKQMASNLPAMRVSSTASTPTLTVLNPNSYAIESTGLIGGHFIGTNYSVQANGAVVIYPNANTVQLYVQGNATQTSNIFNVDKSDGTDLFLVNNAGLATGVNLAASGQTASRAAYFDASKVLTSSATTATELGYLSGVTSAIQTQLGTKITAPGSPAQGDVLYYNGSSWVSLVAGTSGKFLQTQGAGANPTWAYGVQEISEATTTPITDDSSSAPASGVYQYFFFQLPTTEKWYVITTIGWKNGSTVNGNVMCGAHLVDGAPPTGASTPLVAWGAFTAASGTNSTQECTLISSTPIRGGSYVGVWVEGNGTQTFRYQTGASSANYTRTGSHGTDQPISSNTAWTAVTTRPYVYCKYRGIY